MRDEELFAWFRERHPHAGIASVELEGTTVVVRTARPGLLIGRQGEVAEELEAQLRLLRGSGLELRLVELRRVELEPVLVADDVAQKLARGRPADQVIETMARVSLAAGALGCRIVVTGAAECTFSVGAIDEATAERGSSHAVFVPPFEVDDDGNEVPPPVMVGPAPSWEVVVSISKKAT